MSADQASGSDLAIAVIGLAGRFPGARSVDELWANLCDGVESITTFGDAELAASVPAALREDPAYVPRSGVLDGIELFDAGFFGFSPREAELIDPQRRLFMEGCWEALEHAGYDPRRYPGAIGLYAGTGLNGYLLFNLLSRGDLLEDPFELQIASDKDFLATHVAYKLDLRGPCLDVQTACSTSLVAVHLACQALLAGECDMALAGGVGVRVPHRTGYRYRAGAILSSDGHCRAFDARAGGTVGGNGLGLVVLKRLDDAIADRDTIHAVVRGSAINNDGATKVGFSAPSVDGQAKVVRAALDAAGLDATSIGCIEAHGTGTLLGDPIEVAALRQVFRDAAPASCALGSIKTNIGHLDAAAGVAGLIKATLAVRDGRIPPSLHFELANPHLGLDGSPFFVARELGGWPIAGTRRAGVSSFGIGGTNVHVVLEEPPRAAADAAAASAGWTLLPLSARSPDALDATAARLADHLKKHAANLDDVGYTLAVGRRPFDVRRAIVCAGKAGGRATGDAIGDAISALEGVDRTRVVDGQVTAIRPVVFMFPGQGAQHADMGLALYRTEPGFAAIVDRCAHHLREALGFDLREALYPSQFAGQPRDLAQTEVTQPAVFVTSYALAQTLVAHGIRPAALIGHSVGEYVAACLGGVMSLPEALALVAARGRLMQRLPPGAMLAVSLDELEAEAQVRGLPELAIASVNGPGLTVVSGPTAAIEQLASDLTSRGIGARRLVTSHAFHSAMIEPAVAPLVAAAARVALKPPTLRYISNVTGTWITPSEAADPAYYGRHLRMAVRFGPGLAQILHDEPDAIVLEVGPGQTLTTLARASGLALPAARARALATMPPAKPKPASDPVAGVPPMAMTLAALWTHGAELDVAALFAGQARRRVPLPTYPFERQRYWIEPGAQRMAALHTGEPRDPSTAGSTGITGVPPAPALARHPRPHLHAAYAAPDNEIEHQLCEIWQELLGVEPVGVHDNFMELGGHSLLGARMAARLRTSFGVELPLPVMFESPTVAELAVAIERAVIAELEAREVGHG